MGGVESGGAFVDVADDSVLVDHERNSIGEQAREVENSVRLGDLLFGIAQQRKGRAGFGREFPVPFLAVNADSQHLGAGGFELGDISLIRLDLLRSTGSRGAQVESQDDGFLPPEVLKRDHVALLVGQRKIRSAIPHLQSCAGQEQGHQ